MAVRTKTLLDAVTTTGAGSAVAPRIGRRSFQAKGSTSAGAGAATIEVQGSNDGSNWETIATITLTLATTESSDGATTDNAWQLVRGEVTAISGTDAAVSLIMGD